MSAMFRSSLHHSLSIENCRYQDAYIAIVKADHPTWNETAVVEEAKRQFETAALQWFVESLQTCVALRPKAMWGYYGIPLGYDMPCAAPGSQTDPKCGYVVIPNAFHGFQDRCNILQPS